MLDEFVFGKPEDQVPMEELLPPLRPQYYVYENIRPRFKMQSVVITRNPAYELAEPNGPYKFIGSFDADESIGSDDTQVFHLSTCKCRLCCDANADSRG